MTTNLMTWLNDESETVILQRDNTFAMLTWRDFNQQPEVGVTLPTALMLFILTAGLPLLMLS